MHKRQRDQHERMCLANLRQLRNDLGILISEIENGPRREIEIADEHSGIAYPFV